MDKQPQEFLDLAVEEHNRYRRKLDVPELRGDHYMHADAQKYAELLATTRKFESTTMRGRYANQISMSYRINPAEAIKDSINRWYNNKASYRPFQIHSNLLGFGMAWSDAETKWIIVCFYYPAY